MQMAPMATTATTDPEDVLRDALDHTATLRWQAVLDYRDAMQHRGEHVRFAPLGGEIDWLIRASGVRIGEELVVLTRLGADERQQWDGVAGEKVAARAGETILHGRGATEIDLWDVAGRYRRIAVAVHPGTSGERAHVLHQLEGGIG